MQTKTTKLVTFNMELEEKVTKLKSITEVKENLELVNQNDEMVKKLQFVVKETGRLQMEIKDLENKNKKL